MSEPLRLFTEHFPIGGRVGQTTIATLKAVLPFERRQKARQRTRTTAGEDIGVQLQRGTILRGGDLLRAADGTLLEVVAAHEPVSTVFSRSLRPLARVAYHLGNRHVPLQIGAGWVRYLADHVLDAMVTQLGLNVVHDDEPFEPEAGAYGSHSHSRGHADPGHARGSIAFGDLHAVHGHEP
ncbi:MAG: urease accessory protein UreE [Gammaproteobacteria bacterium]